MKTRTLIILSLAVMLTLIAGAAAARPIRTPFTGTTWGIGDNWDYARYWEPGHTYMHWRDVLFFSQIDATDARISGVICWMHNGNYRPSADDPCYGGQGQMFGAIRLEQDGDMVCANAVDYWEGNFVGDRHPDGTETVKVNLKGYGKYAGLQVRWDEWSTGCWGDQEVRLVEGEITDPNGD